MRATPRSAWTLAVPVVTLLAGLLFATSGTTARGTDLRGSDADLPALIRAQADLVDERSEEAGRVRAEVATLEAELPEGRDLARLREGLGALEAQAGLAPVSGPALSVSLSDAGRSAASLPEGVSVDDVVVHQQDVQAVVNALWASGAEAMTIQDQRVISTSAVRCVGNTLILRGRVYSPPFVITAIGDIDALQAGLDRDPAVQLYRQYADRLGLGYDVRQVDATFGGYDGTVDRTRATPAAESRRTP
ncbi:MAG: DUF881 domain-containing protein [Mobilicoccus sp.]|nr:DUF881 domain-containing protein [Mobilicoccus sp.]